MADELLTTGFVIFWRIGFTLSAICLIMQILIYIRVPKSRKLDQKLLTQITIARVLNVAFEYLVVSVPSFVHGWTLDVSLALYFHSDCALICWMFVFSKNLYDKVIRVFTTKKITFVWTSVLVWLLTLPVGIMCPTLLFIDSDYFDVFYKVYGISKFVILSVNLLFFCRIFYVAIKRKISGQLAGIIRTCVITFILVSISSIQVFLTDLLSYFEQDVLTLVFCVINSYQVIAVMAVFLMLVYSSSRKSNQKQISKEPFSVTDSVV